MIEHNMLKEGFWVEVIKHAVNLHSCTVTPVLKSITPTEALLKTTLENASLHIFGCAAIVHIYKEVCENKFAV